MVDYKFVDVSDEAMDMVVDAEFDSSLPPRKAQAVLEVISNALESGTRLAIFFEGLSAFQFAGRRIEMSFRFLRKPEDMKTLSESQRDELSKMRTHFVIHVFARIDRIHRLSSVPFPTDFRNFIELN